MKKIGILKAMALCRKYDALGPADREALRQVRLREIVAHARENSPCYSRLYRDVPEDFTLADLPPQTRGPSWRSGTPGSATGG